MRKSLLAFILVYSLVLGTYTTCFSAPLSKQALIDNPNFAFATFKGGEIEFEEDGSVIRFKNVTVYKSGRVDTNTYIIDSDTYIFENPEEFAVLNDFINGETKWITIIVPVEKNILITNVKNETIHVDGVWGFSKNIVGYTDVITETYNEESDIIVKLKELNILNGDQNGKLNLERYITRAEFMKLIAVISGFSAGEDYGQHFADVTKEHWAYQYIGFCRNKRLIQGTVSASDIASGKLPMFNPDEFIRVEDAMKVVLDLTGYLISMDINRSYADNASLISLIDYMEVFNEKHLTRGNAATVIYNALYIPLMDTNSVKTDETLYTKYFWD